MNLFFRTSPKVTVFCVALIFGCLLQPVTGADIPTLCKKDLPQITLKNLTPPYRDYVYFQNHELFPFEVQATSFSPINAWWLAEASTLVYADEAFVIQAFAKADLKVLNFFDQAGTQCFLAANDLFAILAFRGSQIWKRREGIDPRQMLEDIRTNIDIRMTEWDRGGRVHLGFKTALDNVWNELTPEIAKLQAEGIPVWVTGHSQGAALAALTADRLATVQGVYTFGSPRIGNQEFQVNYSPRTFRLVNGSDIVTSVPPGGLYHHVGELKVLVKREADPDWTDPSVMDRTPLCPQESNSSDNRAGFNSGALIPGSVRDHVPLLYAIMLWNELVDSLNSAVFAVQTHFAPRIDSE